MSEKDESRPCKTGKPRKWHKAVKVTSIVLVSLILLLTAGVGIVVNFVLTPSKITPVVLDVARRQLNADVCLESVDLTFFSTYPRVGLELKDGLIVSRSIRDSGFEKTDTLLQFRRCWVQLNLRAYLKRNRLSFRELEIDSLKVYLFRNQEGKTNYDIVRTATDTVTAGKDTASVLPFKSVSVRKMNLNEAFVYFDDRYNRVYGRVEGADLEARIRLSDSISRVKIEYANRNLIFWQDGKLLAHRMSLKLKTGLKVNRMLKTCELEGTGLKVNDVGFGAKGNLAFDTVSRHLRVDVSFGLKTPSLKDVLSMIPESLIENTGIEAEGEVKLRGKLWGEYGKGVFPEADLSLNLLNGKARYEGMPYGIDTLTADLEAYIDLNRKKPSFADLKILKLKAVDVDILASCKAENLLEDPYLSFTTQSEVDLKALSKIFPFHEGVAMGGVLAADIKGNFLLSDLQHKDYGKISVSGKADFQRIFLNDTTKDFYSNADAVFRFKGGRFLGGNFKANRIHWKGKFLRAYVDTLQVRAYTVPPKDSTHIARLGAEVSFRKMFAKLSDTLFFYNTRTTASASLKPLPDKPRQASVNFDFVSDTMFARSGKAQARLRRAEIHLDLKRFRDTTWWPKAQVDFRRAVFILPEFSQPLRFNRLKASLDGDDVKIERANLRMGRSQLTIKGDFEKLWRVYKKTEPLKARITLRSRQIDCNQLLNALSQPVDSLQSDLSAVSASQEALQDSIDDSGNLDENIDTLQQVRLLRVPKNLDVAIRIDAKKIYYDQMLFENVKGRIVVRNQAVNLRKLDLQTLGADMKMSMVYVAPTDRTADVGFDLDIHNIQIEKLVNLMPSLDSTLPMLRSFEGIVDVQTTASAKLDSSMMIQLPSLTAILRLHGERLVLMDGETFAEISKILLFKNKERNMIDSISAVVAVQQGEVTVYPFIIEIDRYRVGVGGHQDLQMNFDYHISVLKSPVPFKLGINVRGNLDKMKFGVGKALYKNAFTPAYTRMVDSARLDLGGQIIRQFEGWMDRERRPIRRVAFPQFRSGEDGDTVQYGGREDFDTSGRPVRRSRLYDTSARFSRPRFPADSAAAVFGSHRSPSRLAETDTADAFRQ